MKKVLILTVLFCLVSLFTFSNDTTATTNIPVNLEILKHVEVECEDTLDFVYDPDGSGTVDSDSVVFTVLSNYSYVISANFELLAALGLDSTESAAVNGNVVLDYPGTGSAGTSDHILRMDVDFAEMLIDAGLEWWEVEAINSMLVGNVVLTVTAD